MSSASLEIDRPSLQSAVAPPRPVSQSGWIISPIADLFFFLATPLAGIAFAAVLVFSHQDFTLLLLLLSSIAAGHHMPGFLRAFGDPDLFRQYRASLLLAPPLLFAAAFWFELQGNEGLRMVVFVWSVWHTVMQNYGIMRIYDAKRGQISPTTALMDRLTLLAWIPAIDLNNRGFCHDLEDQLYRLGVPFLPNGFLDRAATTMLTVAIVMSVVYAGYTAWLFVRRQPVSFLKLILLTNTVAFFLFAYSITDNILLVSVVSELLHDLQYYSLAWVMQHRACAKRPDASGLLRPLFRRSVLMIALYVMICGLYGSLFTDLLRESLNHAMLTKVLAAGLVASTLFHFYSDGFIWRVRQPQTREYLGIESRADAVSRRVPLPLATPNARRNLAHLAAYALIVGGFLVAHSVAQDRRAQIGELLAERYPTLSKAHVSLADARLADGRNQEAAAEYRKALEADPYCKTEVYQYLAVLLSKSGENAEAIQRLREAMRLAPGHKQPAVAAQLSLLLSTSPQADLRDPVEAIRLARFAADQGGSVQAAYLDALATAYISAQQFDDAEQALQQALAIAERRQDHALVDRLNRKLDEMSSRQ